MSDSEAPRVDKFGAPPEDQPQGSLLYDPTAPIPLDEIDGFGGEYEDEPPSRLPQIVFAALVITVLGVGGYYLVGGSGTELAGDASPEEVTPLPGAGDLSESIVPVPTANLTGTIGATIRVAVRVATRSGMAMADTAVHFSIDSGGGSLTESEVRSNADGIASTSLTLPRRPGTTMLSANVPGTDIEGGRMFVRATAGAPTSIEVVSGNRQRVEIGELLPTRVYVSLSDADGNPAPNAEVRFEVILGDGATAPSRTRTDSVGGASALWRLGLVEGEQRLRAVSSDIPAQVTFSATGLPRTTLIAPGDPEPVETSPVSVTPTTFAVGGSHVCSIDDGLLTCRGGNDRGQTAGGGSSRFVSITTGAAHTCGLDESGVAQCWGGNEGGQLGDGSRADKPRPTTVRTELHFSVLAAGATHTCGLAGGGVPLCWGLNLSGQLGDGTRNDQTVPRTVGGGLIFRTLAAGWSHTCGLTSNGNAFCWGLNSQGQLGDGNTLDQLVPTLVRGAVTTLVAGSAHTCGISQGAVLCWGSNDSGQLGDDTAQNRSQPTEVVGLPGAPTHLAAGAVHTCALVEGGRAYCWGQNFQGQLGDGTTLNHARATAVTGGHSFVEIHAGGAQTCARTADGAEYCWGLNQSGQLGDGTRVSRSAPTRVGG